MDIEDIISFLKSASLLKYSPYNRRNRNRSTRFAMNPSQYNSQGHSNNRYGLSSGGLWLVLGWVTVWRPFAAIGYTKKILSFSKFTQKKIKVVQNHLKRKDIISVLKKFFLTFTTKKMYLFIIIDKKNDMSLKVTF